MAKTKVPGGYIDDGSITSSHLHSSHGITTNDIGEHTNNKYYTDARVDARLAASKSANLFTTGNIEIGSDTGKLRLGTGADLRLYHNGTSSFIDNFTGDLVIQQGVDDADIIFKSDDGSGGTADYLRLLGGHTRILASQHFRITDTKQLQLGDDSDFQATFNGNHTFVTNNTGILYLTQNVDDGVIHIRNDDGSGGVTNYITLHGQTGEVRLSHYGNIKIKTQPDGIDVTGHIDATTLTTTGNVAVGGNLTVTGTTTTVNTVTMNAQNAVVFEGATADTHETTLTIIDPTADRTINLPNQSGTIPVLAAASNTAITATPAELNYVDGVTSNIQTQLDAKQATISSSTDLTLSSIVATSSNESRFNALSIGGDSDVYLYESATNAFTIRTGASGAYKYFTFAADGKLNLANDGLQIGGTEVISGGRNLSNIGTGTFSGDVQIGGTVSGTHALKVYHTDNYEAAKFTTNQAGSLARFTDTTASVEFGVQSGLPVIRTSNTARLSISGADVRVNTGALQMGTTTVIDSSRNLTNIGTVSASGNITTSGAVITGDDIILPNDKDVIFKNASGSDDGTKITRASGNALRFKYTGNVAVFDALADNGFQIRNSNDTVVFQVVPNSTLSSSYTDVIGGLRLGGTMVINSSRNLVNIGTITTSGNATFGGNIIGNDVKAAGSGGLSLQTDEGTKRIEILDSGVVRFNTAYTFPTSDGSANQVLQTDGSGALSFATVSSGGSGFSTITEPSAGQIKIGAQSGANEGGEILLENAAANGGGSYTTDIHLDNYQNQFRIHAAGTVLFQTATGTGNSTVGGTLTSGDIFIEDGVTPKLTISDTGNAGGGGASGKILFKNTAGDAMGIGYTSNSTADSDMIISTNAGGTYGGYLGLATNAITDAQSDIILEPKTNVRIATGSLEMGTTAFVDQSRNVTAGSGTFTGAISTSSGGNALTTSANAAVFAHGFTSGSRGFNFESGDESVGTIRFDANTMRIWSGGAGGGNERIRINDGSTDDGDIFFYGSLDIKSGGLQVGGTTRINSVGDGKFTSLYIGGTSVITTSRVLENVTANASIITAGTFGAARIPNLDAGKITSGTINSARLATGASGNWWAGNVVKVLTDGVMEIGRYIDFHNTDTTTADYDVRLDANTANSLNVTGVSTTDGLRVEGNKVFHAGNDGAGSGLNADVLQGNGPSYYRNASNLNSGTVATSRLPAAALNYQQSTDDRDMKPNTSGIHNVQAIKPFFSSFGGMTGSADTTYVDVIAIDTYSDSSGGGPSAITFHKGESAGDPKMYIWKAGWNASTWSTGQRVFADNYHPNADTLTTARTIAGTSFNGSANIDISYNNLTNKPTIPTNNNQLTNGAGYITSADGGNADTLDGVNSTSFARVDAGSTYSNYGNLQRFYSNTNLATASGSQASLECFSSGSGNDAFMTFHVGGDYAVYFGLDGGTNKLSVGGWSAGANSYEIYHSGNKPSLATLGYTGATDANNYVFPYTISTSASNSTVVRRNQHGYIFSNYINTTDNTITSGVGEIIVKNTSDDYHRSATAGAVRTFLNVADGATANSTESVSASNNTLVKRHSSGYVFANYFNTTANDVSSGVTKVMVETGNDNYIRHGDTAAIQTFINAAENGASTIHKLASNGYSQIQNWQNVGGTGLYSTTANSGHFLINQNTSYGTWRSTGSRGGYDGLVLDGGGGVAFMTDGSGNGGIYRQASSRWYMYHHVGNNCTGFSNSTTSSSYSVYVSGALYATGDIVGSSDERLKTEIKTIPNALDKVLKLRGVTYKWKDTTEGGTCVNNITETRMGVIAQEVVDILPEVVTHDKENDRYGVSYGHLTGVLIEAVKELKQEVNELKKELEEVKNG